jgi:hypothetical protein
VAEKKNRSLIEISCRNANPFGNGSINTANRLQNMLSIETVDITPCEKWHRNTSCLNYITMFGNIAYLIPKEQKQKQDQIPVKRIFIE